MFLGAGVKVPGESVVGVVSDTHGQLPARVKLLLQGVHHIIHAGDIGSPQVLAELQAIAPVTAVRGNCDLEAWALALPTRAELELEGVRILVNHIAGVLQTAPDVLQRTGAGLTPEGRAEDCTWDVVITGHSHLASVEQRDGTLYLNPGSAGPRRFGRPRTVAKLVIRGPGVVADVCAAPGVSGARLSAEIVEVEETPRR